MGSNHHSVLKRWAGDRRATSAVEFALISPLFILLLFGMLAYGIYFGASHSVQQIAADAARAAVAGLNANERQIIVSRYIDAHGAGYPLVDPSKLTIATADDPSGDGEFTVALGYDAGNLPIWNLLPDLPLPGKTIVKRSVIRIGGL